jgi:hypothetical protein
MYHMSNGGILTTITARQGYWRVDNTSTDFLQCARASNCVGGSNSGGDADCGDNHRTGPICSLCVAGYHTSTDSGTGSCVTCPSKSSSLALTIFFCILIAVAVCVLYYFVLRSSNEESFGMRRQSLTQSQAPFDERLHDALTFSRETRDEPSFMFNLKIVVGFFQIATRLSLYVKTPWPSGFQAFMSAFELLNFEFIPWQSVACVASIDFYTKFWYYFPFFVCLCCIIHIDRRLSQ